MEGKVEGRGSTQPGPTFSLVYSKPLLQHQAKFGLNRAVKRTALDSTTDGFMVTCSTREKVVKFLQSNPMQILLCVIVLLDAGVVIAQILLDLNSVKGAFTETAGRETAGRENVRPSSLA